MILVDIGYDKHFKDNHSENEFTLKKMYISMA